MGMAEAESAVRWYGRATSGRLIEHAGHRALISVTYKRPAESFAASRLPAGLEAVVRCGPASDIGISGVPIGVRSTGAPFPEEICSAEFGQLGRWPGIGEVVPGGLKKSQASRPSGAVASDFAPRLGRVRAGELPEALTRAAVSDPASRATLPALGRMTASGAFPVRTALDAASRWPASARGKTAPGPASSSGKPSVPGRDGERISSVPVDQGRLGMRSIQDGGVVPSGSGDGQQITAQGASLVAAAPSLALAAAISTLPYGDLSAERTSVTRAILGRTGILAGQDAFSKRTVEMQPAIVPYKGAASQRRRVFNSNGTVERLGTTDPMSRRGGVAGFSQEAPGPTTMARERSGDGRSGTTIALHGHVNVDGRKMGSIVAAGQVSAASLPAVSASALNLRALPVFRGTSAAI